MMYKLFSPLALWAFTLLFNGYTLAWAAESDIEVVVMEQDSQGLVEADLDSEVLQSLGEWMLDLTATKLKSAYDRKHVSYQDIKSEIALDSSYVTYKGKKLAVFELYFTSDNSPVKVTRVLGIKDKRIISIGCVSKSGKNIDKFHGPCGEKVNEAFYK